MKKIVWCKNKLIPFNFNPESFSLATTSLNVLIISFSHLKNHMFYVQLVLAPRSSLLSENVRCSQNAYSLKL
jgi:hypothetical protein